MIMIIALLFAAWLLWALLAPSLRVVWSYRRELVAHFTRSA